MRYHPRFVALVVSFVASSLGCSVGPSEDLGTVDGGGLSGRPSEDTGQAELPTLEPGRVEWLSRFDADVAESFESLVGLSDRMVIGGATLRRGGSRDGVIVHVDFDGSLLPATRQVEGLEGPEDIVSLIVMDGAGVDFALLQRPEEALRLELDELGFRVDAGGSAAPPGYRVHDGASLQDGSDWALAGTAGASGWLGVGGDYKSFRDGAAVTVDAVALTQSSLERVLAVAGTRTEGSGGRPRLFVETVELDLSASRWAYDAPDPGWVVLDFEPDQRGGLVTLTWEDERTAWLTWLDASGDVFARRRLPTRDTLPYGFVDVVGGIGGHVGLLRRADPAANVGVEFELFRLDRDGRLLGRSVLGGGGLERLEPADAVVVSDDLVLSDGSIVLAGRTATGALLLRMRPALD